MHASLLLHRSLCVHTPGLERVRTHSAARMSALLLIAALGLLALYMIDLLAEQRQCQFRLCR